MLALAFEVAVLSDSLVAYDSTENRAHRALGIKGNAAQVIAALIAGDEKEARMLAVLRARAASIRTRAAALTARISGMPDQPVGMAGELFAEMAN